MNGQLNAIIWNKILGLTGLYNHHNKILSTTNTILHISHIHGIRYPLVIKHSNVKCPNQMQASVGT